MTNNKQSMKLYTEEQLIQAFKSGMNACMKHKDWALAINYPNKIELLEYMQSLTPIELPSDEEIEEIAMAVYGFKATSVKEVLEYKAFKRGARLIMNKIKGGNNEKQ